MDIKQLGEFGLIRRLSSKFQADHPRIVKGIGDDTSVTVQDSSKYLLCTTDTLVEDIHFSLKYTPPDSLGRKAISVSLSDIAAMGGAPLFLLTSIAIPAGTSTDFLELLYKGIKERADEFGVSLIGGNTSASSDKIQITTTLLGEADKDKIVFRGGARKGDLIFITGTPGDSGLGMKLLAGGKSATSDSAVLKHIDPAPRVRAGMEIAARRLATAMIDISDGLISDLRHIAEESSAGARIWMNKIPLSEQMKEWLAAHPQDIALPLCGGEDYELLFTVDKTNAEKTAALALELGLPITGIGEIVSEKEGVSVFDEKGNIFPASFEGYEHFRR